MLIPQFKSVDTIQTIAGAEKFLDELAASRFETLGFINPVKFTSVGAKSACIQAIATWSKQAASPKVILGKDAMALDNDEALVASLLAREVSEEAGGSIKHQVYSAARQRIEKMERGPTPNWIDGSVLLLCADMTTKASLPCLYDCIEGENIVRGSEDFQYLVEDVGDAIFKFRKFLNPFRNSQTKRDLRPFATILRELFKNTDQHARKDQFDVEIKRSVRGIHAQLFSNENVSLSKSPLGDYLSMFSKNAFFLEFSVFDSGPGLAQRWLRKTLSNESLEQEFTAVRSCFGRYKTTSNSLERGIGLPDVMRALDSVKGFLRLRTGRLGLYRNFVSNRYREDEAAPGANPGLAVLLDWNTGRFGVTEHSFTDGALFTAVVPFEMP